MSGIGEVLAIVSCVAGLIQAYDAGSRIVRQIKARRQAHGALPPSDLLEQSIDKGRKEIQKLVEDGRQRFGPSFEEGDSEQINSNTANTVANIPNLIATAQLALYKITIATQQALLDGLTQARDDDGIIDFDYCIDTSDKGRNEALLALHQLFQRKLEEEMDRKRSNPARPSQAPVSAHAPGPYSSPPSYQHASLHKEVEGFDPAQKEEEQPPSPLPKIKKSRTFGQAVFRRKSSNTQDNYPPKRDGPRSDKLADVSPGLSEQEMKPSVNRRNKTTSMLSNATWSSTSTDSTVVRPGSIARSNTSASSITMVSRRDTTFSTMSRMSSRSGMSAVSSMSNMSISPITKYGACCKYAYELREGNIKKGLMLQMAGFYGGHAFYSCPSTKCEYQGPAAQDKKGYKIDHRVFNTPQGIKYRWLILAKSHVPQRDSQYPSFRCLVCVLSKDDSAIYDGKESLFAHLADHQGAFLGETLIGGQLIFDNHGARLCQDSEFDIKFPELAPIEPVQEQGVAVVVSATLPLETRHFDPHLPVKTSSTTPYPYESDDNPWVN